MQIDLERWSRVLAELRDARFASRAVQLQRGEAEQAWLAAQATRDRCADAGELRWGRRAEIRLAAEDNLRVAEERLSVAAAEMARVQERGREASARFQALANTARIAPNTRHSRVSF